MTTADRLERDLPDLLAALVTPAASEDLTATLERIAVVRQRPAWTLLERWLSLDIAAQTHPLRGRTAALRPIVLVVSLALVILAGLLLAVGSRPEVPLPFGPAGNGVILFQTSDLDIVAGDPATGAITTLIDGPTSPDFQPVFSNDGRRFLFVRDESLMIANADGSGIRELIATTPLCVGGSFRYAWSPGGDRLALTGFCGKGGVMLDLDDGVMTPFRGFTNPEGWLASSDQVVVMSSRQGLSVVDADGTGKREIATWPQALEGWTLSPDGSKFAYMNYAFYTTGDPHPHILDLESGIDRQLDMEGAVVQFSPDGTKLLVVIMDFRQVRTRTNGSTVETLTPPGQLAMLPLDGGPAVPIDVPSAGLQGMLLSPDGSAILAEYWDEATERLSTWLFDIASGDGRQVFWPAPNWALSTSSWQRLAR